MKTSLNTSFELWTLARRLVESQDDVEESMLSEETVRAKVVELYQERKTQMSVSNV